MPTAPSGNRNLALGTSGEWSELAQYFRGSTNETRFLYVVKKAGMQIGDTIQLRAVLKYDNVVPVEGKTAQCWAQTEGDVTHWDNGRISSTQHVNIIGSDEVVLTSTTTVDENHMLNDSWNFMVRFDYVVSGTAQIKELKVEVGDLPTPYSQAPEDLGWSSTALVPTQQQRYLWKFEYVYYSDGSVEVSDPINLSIAGADADTTGVTDAINQTNQTVAGLQSSVSQAQSDLATVSSNLTQARQDLESSIASVNTKAQAVETTLAQVQSTANANSQKTATLENDLDGLSAKFSSLKIGGRNLLAKTNQGKTNWVWSVSKGSWSAETVDVDGISAVKLTRTSAETSSWSVIEYQGLIRNLIEADTDYTLSFDVYPNVDVTLIATLVRGDSQFSLTNSKTMNTAPAEQWTKVSTTLHSRQTLPEESGQLVYLRGMPCQLDNYLIIKNIKLEKGNIATDYSPNEADLELKVAEYKQNADQNYASLQTTVQNLDGTVQQNKTAADQTAQGFSTRIESLETYKDGETARANQYFESAKTETARQLTAERTAIANDYVAKSTYTSDVTGLRNDLTATTTTANTTKTNLASYQASNNQAVASLQSSLQTTDGNVSNLQTQINAVPGQITSAVSAVEGKIPKTAGGRNLALGTSNQWSSAASNFKGKDNETRFLYKIINDGLSVGNTIKLRVVLKYDNVVPVEGKTAQCWAQTEGDVTHWDNGRISSTQHVNIIGSDEVVLESSTIIDSNHLRNDYWNLMFRFDYVTSGSVQVKNIKAEVGDLPTPWSPAPEDTASQISSLSSQIQQTADGMTLLATKTELNSAKSDLQAGITTATSKADSAQATANNNAQTISTHTTQISALNTGLQAKVSQSDFDSLSGRVTTAESNLTATANQLSSQISSVSERIPSEIGAVNLFKGSRDFSGSGWINNNGVYAEDYQGVKIFKTQNKWGGRSQFFEVKSGEEYVFSAYVKSSSENDEVTFYLTHTQKEPQTSGWIDTNAVNNSWCAGNINLTDEYQRIAVKIRIASDGWMMPRLERYNNEAYLFFGGYKLERGNIATDYSPNPEDYDAALTQAKSEIKQTTDAITASVSSVETKANTAQSTANTAVSKADAAQAGVNTLDSTTVKSASLNLDNNGFVTKVGKTINGNKFATMIAQDANSVKIIADEMQVTADMIVNGAVTADKLNVSNLSAVNSNLGKIEGGSLLLQENKSASSSVDNWGTFNRPAHKQGLYMDNHGLASSGTIQRKNGSETTPTDMPLTVLQSGELRFLVVDYNDDLENVLHYGLSDPDYGAIRFEIDSELKRRLTMTSSGYLNFQASNYTDWIPLSQLGCEYMIQGRLVAVNYDVTYSQGGTHKIGDIPQEFVKKELMLTAKAWSITPNDKNFQLNADGSLHLLNADANVTYRGTLLFSY